MPALGIGAFLAHPATGPALIRVADVPPPAANPFAGVRLTPANTAPGFVLHQTVLQPTTYPAAGGLGLRDLSSPAGTAAPIADLYAAVRGSNGVLGAVVRGPISGLGWQKVEYQNGAIYSSFGLGTFALSGRMWQKYQSLGADAGLLGLPTSGVRRQITTTYATFQNGMIVVRPDEAAPLVVSGKIWGEYQRVGGSAALGLPTGPEVPVAGSPGYRVQRFSQGAIYGIPTRVNGLPGYQLQAAYAVYNGVVPAGSAPVLNGTPDFWSKWQALGGEHSPLGRPVNRQVRGPQGGLVQVFEHGALLWSPATGIHAVQGVIFEYYWYRLGGAEVGVSGRFLGYPIADEKKMYHGYRSLFENGRIVFDEKNREFLVWRNLPPNEILLVERTGHPMPGGWSFMGWVTDELAPPS